MKIIRSPYVFAAFTIFLMGYASIAVSDETLPKGNEQEEIVVGDMNFLREKSGAERVCFGLNRFCNPKIFSIPGKKPRIVIDVKPVQQWFGKASTQVNGKQIKRVRTHLHKAEEKLRIVLDLNPSMEFFVQPQYYETDRVYCVYVLSK